MKNSLESSIIYWEFMLNIVQIYILKFLRIHEHIKEIANYLILAGMISYSFKGS